MLTSPAQNSLEQLSKSAVEQQLPGLGVRRRATLNEVAAFFSETAVGQPVVAVKAPTQIDAFSWAMERSKSSCARISRSGAGSILIILGASPNG